MSGWQLIAVGRRKAEFCEVQEQDGVTFVINHSEWEPEDDLTQDQFLTGICTLIYFNWRPHAPVLVEGFGAWKISFYSISAHPQAPEFARRERLFFKRIDDEAGEVVCLQFLRGEDLRLLGGLPIEIANKIGVAPLATDQEIQNFTGAHAARERAAK